MRGVEMKDALIGCIDHANSWEDINRFYEKLTNVRRVGRISARWVFRGEKSRNSEKSTSLKTSFDKACGLFGISNKNRLERQKDMIREFQRKLYLYAKDSPSRNDLLEWLALMQHHGAPTPMLDCTYSFFIALYFALAQIDCATEYAEIWALNADRLLSKAQRVLKAGRREITWLESKLTEKRSMEYMDAGAIRDNAIIHYLLQNPKNLVYTMNPFRLNQRLTIQQGLFLLAGDATKSFMENLRSQTSPGDGNIRRLQIRMDTGEKNKIMRQLYRMNVTNAALFPGLDGFANSMRERLAFAPEELLFIGLGDRYPFL